MTLRFGNCIGHPVNSELVRTQIHWQSQPGSILHSSILEIPMPSHSNINSVTQTVYVSVIPATPNLHSVHMSMEEVSNVGKIPHTVKFTIKFYPATGNNSTHSTRHIVPMQQWKCILRQEDVPSSEVGKDGYHSAKPVPVKELSKCFHS